MILGRPERPYRLEPVCAYCGYDLSGLANRRCPECGRTTPLPPRPEPPGPPPPPRWYYVRAVVVSVPLLVLANAGYLAVLSDIAPRCSRIDHRIESLAVAANVLALVYAIISGRLTRTPQDEKWATACFTIAFLELIWFSPGLCSTIR
jgi:hypothetical protein